MEARERTVKGCKKIEARSSLDFFLFGLVILRRVSTNKAAAHHSSIPQSKYLLRVNFNPVVWYVELASYTTIAVVPNGVAVAARVLKLRVCRSRHWG